MKNVITYPSADKWATTRADNIRQTTENSVVRVQKPISNIVQVLVNPDSWMPMSTATGTILSWKDLSLSADGSTPFVIDMTSRIVEYEKWQTLPTKRIPPRGEQYQTNTIYYKRKGTDIALVGGSTFWEKSPIYYAINQQIATMLQNGEVYWKNSDGEWVNLQDMFNKGLISPDIQDDSCTIRSFWRVKYISFGEIVKLNVVKANLQDNDFAIPYSQQQQIASTVGLGRNMQSNSDRLGTIKREVVRYKAIPYQIGTYYTDANGDIWRLTDIDCAVVPQFIKATETWAKNWNIKSKFVGVNREFRSWDIPSDILQRNLLYQDYLLLSETTRTIQNNSLLVVGAKKMFIDGIATPSYNYNTEISVMSMWHTSGAKKVGALIGVSAFGFGNSVVFSGSTKDNLSAGVQRAADGSSDNNLFNRDVYYCEDDGTLANMTVQMSTKFDSSGTEAVEAANLYPYSEVNGDSYINKALDGATAVVALFQNGGAAFTVLKDAAEQLNFTYQVHILTSSPKLIIGTAWAANCPLVRNRNGMTIKIWDLTAPLPQGAQVMTSGYGAVTTDLSKFQTITTAEPFILRFTPGSGKKGVCVTDGDNNIMVAYNGTTAKDFYAYFTHKYKDLK